MQSHQKTGRGRDKRRQRRKDRDNETGFWREEMNPEMKE